MGHILRRLAVFSLTMLVVSGPWAEGEAQGDRRIRLGSAHPPRYALVIGNSAYEAAPLQNPEHDAAAMAAVLREVGFTVTHLTNAGLPAMEAAVRALRTDLGEGGVGLFYFAGHGVQTEGSNYLLPIGAGVQDRHDIKYKALAAQWVVESLESAGNGLNIAILDACRDDPYARRVRGTGPAGLAQMESGAGMLIAFATKPGEVAADGAGRHSPYTRHLVEQIRVPGVSIEEMFKRVRAGVVRETDSAQTPQEWTTLTGTFQFVPGSADSTPPGPPLEEERLEKERRDRLGRERMAKEKIQAAERSCREVARPTHEDIETIARWAEPILNNSLLEDIHERVREIEQCIEQCDDDLDERESKARDHEYEALRRAFGMCEQAVISTYGVMLAGPLEACSQEVDTQHEAAIRNIERLVMSEFRECKRLCCKELTR